MLVKVNGFYTDANGKKWMIPYGLKKTKNGWRISLNRVWTKEKLEETKDDKGLTQQEQDFLFFSMCEKLRDHLNLGLYPGRWKNWSKEDVWFNNKYLLKFIPSMDKSKPEKDLTQPLMRYMDHAHKSLNSMDTLPITLLSSKNQEQMMKDVLKAAEKLEESKRLINETLEAIEIYKTIKNFQES